MEVAGRGYFGIPFPKAYGDRGLGGLGYLLHEQDPVERMYHDVRILRIYEGANEVHHMVIGSELFRDP
jgi:alkylation response protein AidB-like acyl-CoA dehydrogenase